MIILIVLEYCDLQTISYNTYYLTKEIRNSIIRNLIRHWSIILQIRIQWPIFNDTLIYKKKLQLYTYRSLSTDLNYVYIIYVIYIRYTYTITYNNLCSYITYKIHYHRMLFAILFKWWLYVLLHSSGIISLWFQQSGVIIITQNNTFFFFLWACSLIRKWMKLRLGYIG